MKLSQRFADWLETHWVAPAYAGWLLGGIGICFFIAATNTLSGWLYVISGVMAALLVIAAILSERSLRQIQVKRQPIDPVSVGNPLTIELRIENPTPQIRSLVQIQDVLPLRLGSTVKQAIEVLEPNGHYRWTYDHPTQYRGVYRWQQVNLRTAAPLGLFWCRRSRTAPALAIVYPLVLPLSHCPLIDQMGREDSFQFQSSYRSQADTEGITRALRPYRWGDSTRLIHWRTSARYGELRVRELELFTGGQEVIIALDSGTPWQLDAVQNPNPRSRKPQPTAIASEAFEQAVTAAASLFFYAKRQQINVWLWTAGSGLVHGDRPVLEALAATYVGEDRIAEIPEQLPMVWLTQNPASLATLPPGSRWLLWPQSGDSDASSTGDRVPHPGIAIQGDDPLQLQLQATPR